jgi:hypothetical protein
MWRLVQNTVLGTAILGCFLPPTVFGITLGQTDDFSDGTSAGWIKPATSPPATASGGPAGAGDLYLENSSHGYFGPDSRMAILNRTQWTGNYLAGGIDEIDIDLTNVGSSDLDIRIALSNTTGPASTWYASETAFHLPADGLWRSATFGLTASDLAIVSGAGSEPLATVLESVLEFRIVSATEGPNFRADAIAGTLGVDNITASTMCDFNADFTCDLADINLMYDEGNLVTGVSVTAVNSQFDLDNDSLINNQDIADWLLRAATVNGYASSYMAGDTDGLNSVSPTPRDVDLGDYNALATHFDPSAVSAPHPWEHGNSDGDSDIDLTDYNALAFNFVPSGYGTQVVPEPTSLIMFLLGTIGWLMNQRSSLEIYF